MHEDSTGGSVVGGILHFLGEILLAILMALPRAIWLMVKAIFED